MTTGSKPQPAASNSREAKTIQHQHRIPDAQRAAISSPDLAWSHSNDLSNDFRSDSYTKPTLPMLEDYMASLVGREASLLVASGTLENPEWGSASYLTGITTRQAIPSNGYHITLDDVKRESTLGESIYEVPIRIISLENTLNGTIPLSDIRAIAPWARGRSPSIHAHLDGAPLWEAVARGAITLHAIGDCFDSIQLCFTKGVGAPLGGIVTGSSVYIERAEWGRKSLGGGIRATKIIAASARVAVDDVFFVGNLQAGQEKAKGEYCLAYPRGVRPKA
ncbi:pyridoxal phosphate-dependent transferase [Aspergillus alliaceus]|uniref:pyridoxal phosphate-dependent transferase n=1 Tax=Petromyces alliaceus TaxID=209559 RepID=UPI0012A586E6|nr:pyridoxal phosphate-dependent transferase [Aspergillus alliaceus]KAB8232208.1 pyridoxal phosphate-dependent transferase [Aspergillus alliaceus]